MHQNLPTRLFDYAYYQARHQYQAQSLSQREEGVWKRYSSDDIVQISRAVASGLIRLGVQPGDTIGLVIESNQVEWLLADLGIQQAGAITVPVYSTISYSEFEYIFNDAEIRYLFCANEALWEKMQVVQPGIPSLQGIFCFASGCGCPEWKSMWGDPQDPEIDKRIEKIGTHDLATLIYTSGTTGVPKGVMLSHHNIVSNINSVQSLLPVGAGARTLSFLPLCHIFEKVKTYVALYLGLNVHFVGIDNLGGEDGDLMAVKPHFFTAVPRLLEKVYDRIVQKGKALKGIKRMLFFWALRLTDSYDFDYKPRGWKALQWKIAHALIFSKWRAALGGEVVGIFTGAAACPEKIVRVFSAAGIPVREGYGLTESSPGLTVNKYDPQEAMLGTVGKALPDVEIEIDMSDGSYRADEGEILASGPNIMMGYYKAPEKTAEVIFEKDGKRWLRTGDIGKLVDGPGGTQFLKITDRKKELFKTSGGKYVAPAPIEAAFKEDFLVDNIMLVGDDRKFVSALIVPAADALKNWYQQQGLAWKDLQEAIANPRVRDLYDQLLDQYNTRFSKVEQVKRFELVPEPWEATKPDGSTSELTPTLKLKRRVILEKCKEAIDRIYREKPGSED